MSSIQAQLSTIGFYYNGCWLTCFSFAAWRSFMCLSLSTWKTCCKWVMSPSDSDCWLLHRWTKAYRTSLYRSSIWEIQNTFVLVSKLFRHEKISERKLNHRDRRRSYLLVTKNGIRYNTYTIYRKKTSTINLERVKSAAHTVTFRRKVPPTSSDSSLRAAKFFRRILRRLISLMYHKFHKCTIRFRQESNEAIHKITKLFSTHFTSKINLIDFTKHISNPFYGFDCSTFSLSLTWELRWCRSCKQKNRTDSPLLYFLSCIRELGNQLLAAFLEYTRYDSTTSLIYLICT
jgi:hypothetical protein